MDSTLKEYVVIGAGPAALCAVAKLVASGEVAQQNLVWIDPKFELGAFGTSLSAGSSVPGNTDVESYMRVIDGIASLIPACKVPSDTWKTFEISDLEKTARGKTCPIKIAAAPLKYVSDRLAELVTQIKDTVTAIESLDDENKPNGPLKVFLRSGASLRSRRVILATGSEPHTLELPHPLKVVDPNTAFISSELDALIAKETPALAPGSKLRFAVVGSSHSAALAVMNLIKAGVPVKQFMNKPYKFATKQTAPDGTVFTQFDNTGLKGDVAAFTRTLLEGKAGTTSQTQETETQKSHAALWSYYIGAGEIDPVEIADCTHSVVCIGYTHCDTLTIDKKPLAKFSHDSTSSAILSSSSASPALKGVFGIGIAFPKHVTAPSGESEFAVGVGKFWSTIDDKMLDFWQCNPSS